MSVHRQDIRTGMVIGLQQLEILITVFQQMEQEAMRTARVLQMAVETLSIGDIFP